MASLDIIEQHLGIDFANVRLRNGRKRHNKNQYYYFPHQYYIVHLGGLNKWCIMSSSDRTRHLLDEYVWRDTHGYAASFITVEAKKTHVSMHRLITSCPDGEVVDHINRCKCDNRVENLRTCSQAENNRNITKRKDNTSGATGVRCVSEHGREYWMARINDDDGKKISKRFNIQMYGNAAKQKAIEWRKQKEQELGYIGE